MADIGAQPFWTQPRERGAVAYALWLVLGLFGAHRIFLSRYATGAAQCLLGAVCLPTAHYAAAADTTTGVKLPLLLQTMGSALGLMILLVWLITDAFLIPGMTRGRRARENGARRTRRPDRRTSLFRKRVG